VYPALHAVAELYGRAERALYVDLYVRGQRWESCQSGYLVRFGLTARQFNAIRITLGGKVDAARQALLSRVTNLRAAVAAAEKTVAKLAKREQSLGRRATGPGGQFAPDGERAEVRARAAFRLHQERRRLESLRARLRAAEKDRQAGRIHLCFGGKRMFHGQFALKDNGYGDSAQWRRQWRRARSSPFFCVGSQDEAAGNQTCTRQGDGSLRLCVPPSLAERSGHWFTIPPLRFPYGQEAVEAALAAGQAVSYRFVRRERKGCDVWYVQATVERTPADVTTRVQTGAVGVDFNPAHVDVAEVDRFGNPLHARRIPVAVQGRNADQVAAALGEVTAGVVAQAQAAGKPVVVERLDFREKKARLREVSDRQARLLSAFAYRRFHTLLRSRAARQGVGMMEVNPAYTSVLGWAKFGSGYGLSPHAAAAVAIARRGLGFRERFRSRSAFPLPVRNRGKHVWSDWRRVAQRLRAEGARGRRPSGGGRGRGIPRSSAAPAATPGPPCDGLAAVPGVRMTGGRRAGARRTTWAEAAPGWDKRRGDPPAQNVGNTVRLAS
jgi:IS605 OrfB family transposase